MGSGQTVIDGLREHSKFDQATTRHSGYLRSSGFQDSQRIVLFVPDAAGDFRDSSFVKRLSSHIAGVLRRMCREPAQGFHLSRGQRRESVGDVKVHTRTYLKIDFGGGRHHTMQPCASKEISFG